MVCIHTHTQTHTYVFQHTFKRKLGSEIDRCGGSGSQGLQAVLPNRMVPLVGFCVLDRPQAWLQGQAEPQAELCNQTGP